jgi:cystine transport system substrate-binding protein
MKKLLSLALVAVLSVSVLVGCGSKASSKDALESIKDKGTITIGLEGDWQPWSYHDKDSNKVIGYDADIARELGKRLGVKVKLVEAPWESLFAGLDDGRYDLVINGVDITKERQEKYDFSDPYAHIHTALVVKGDNTEIKSFEDLKGKKTVNSIGSTYMTLAEKYGATATGVSTLDETIQNVIDGRADATLNSEDSIATYLAEQPDANIKVVATTDDASDVGIPMKKGEKTKTLRDAVNKAVSAMRKDGTLAEISKKYFNKDVSLEK